MPIYEYRCSKCRKNFEILQKISEKPLATCPTCGKKVKRLISRTSFALKGGGWYKDGYTSASAAKTSSSTPSKTSKPAEKKTETPSQPKKA